MGEQGLISQGRDPRVDGAASGDRLHAHYCSIGSDALIIDHRKSGVVSVDADITLDLTRFVEFHVDALWLIRPGGTVIYLNERARHLALTGYPMGITENGKLVVASGDGKTDLSASILAAVRQPGKTTIFICQSSGQATFQVSVAPAGPRLDDQCAVILIRNLSETAQLRSKAAEALYSLTPSEVRVLESLLKGLTPQRVAAATGTKITTVRTQIASVLSKAGVRRQADLLAQVLNFTGI